MINKNVLQYAMQTWDTYIKPLSEVSKSSDGKSLVNRSEKVYWFDGISDEVYTGINFKPRSVDGLFFSEDAIYFVEFKTGFKKRRTKENFDDEYAKCPQYGTFCKDFKEWFFKMQDKETEELKTSIKLKAIESYFTLDRKILPYCADIEQQYKIVLIVVIDEDEVDYGENIFFELSEDHVPPNADKNSIYSIKESLQGYKKHGNKDKPSTYNDYFYDDIKVLSAKEFEMLFEKLSSNIIKPSNPNFQHT